MLQLFPSSSVVSRTVSVLCVYSKFGHHPHPLATFVPNFVSVVPSASELADGENRVLNHSITQLIQCPGNQSPCALEKYTFNMHQVGKQIIVQPNGWLNLPQSTTLPPPVTAKQ